jgi:hypothetical protein
MTLPRLVQRGAWIGLSLGLLLALALLAAGEFSMGEPMEGAMYLAIPLSMPVGLILLGAGLGDLATTWIPFILLALPANGLLWGLTIGTAVWAWARPERSRPST